MKKVQIQPCVFREDGKTKVSIYIYHHVSRYLVASKKNHFEPDVFLSIDWLDDFGCISNGLCVQGDHFLLRYFCKKDAYIIDFLTVFGLSLKVYKRSDKEFKFDVENDNL